MTYFSAFAVFFIIWWTTLFAVLPFNLRTQADEGEYVPGTEPSAPKGPHVRRAMLRTTVVSLLIFGALYILVKVYGLSFEDIPQIVPDFR